MSARDLPIAPLLGDICTTLRAQTRLVLAAPPGAGKTTRVPLALVGLLPGFEALPGKIVVLEPRRVAARMAAARMAATLGEKIGQTIGLTTRLERRAGQNTRIEIVTEGVFVRRLLADPELCGISAVIFDEVHERSLTVDLALALALDTQSALREDLLLLAMSATLDTDRVAERLAAPVIEAQGRAWPVDTIYLGRTRAPLADQITLAIQRALRETQDSILVFLPGAADIRRVASLLHLPAHIHVCPLYGALSPEAQDAALNPPAPGQRKIVLATDIAESALTIEGVSVVIDAGLARLPDYDPQGQMTGLKTVRASLANIDQRRGRAGRTGPGVCYRLWDAAETRGFTRAPEPEIERADLTGAILALAEWGERDPANLTWLTPPPAGRVLAAQNRLQALGALDQALGLTPKGREMSRLPLPPALAALIVEVTDPGEKALAARIAAVLSEPGTGGRSPDLTERLRTFETDRSQRAKRLKAQAAQWGGAAAPKGDPGQILARGWPAQIARRRQPEGATYLLASGRAGHLEESSALSRHDWIVVANMIGAAKAARITLAAPLDESHALLLGQVETVETAQFDPQRHSFRARRVKRLGAIILNAQPLPRPAPSVAQEAVFQHIETEGFAQIGWEAVIAAHIARVRALRTLYGEIWPDMGVEDLQQSVRSWMATCVSRTDFSIPGPEALRTALKSHLGWPLMQDLDLLAPLKLALPNGRKVEIDWIDPRAPLVACRVQEVYGWTNHPALADGKLPVTLQLLSPGRKPVATTRDLPAFWSGGYRDMVKDMRGRYPKHDWPDDPAHAAAHIGMTKARLAKRR